MTLKSTSMMPVELRKNTKFWLLIVASCLTAVHLSLIHKYGDENLISISMILLGAVLFISWENHDKLSIKSDVYSKFIGIGIIAFVILKSAYISSFEPFVQFSPLLSAIGVGLFASGVKGLKQYWQQLVLLLTLAIPLEAIIPYIVDLAPATAKLSAIMLSCLGFKAHSQGIDVFLPTGAVAVSPHCTGLNIISRLLRLSILLLVMFPSNWIKSIFVPIVAVLIAFIGNGIRVAVLAVCVANSQQGSFDFFHGPGGHIFTITSVVVFGSFYYFISRINRLEAQEPVEN